MFWLYIKRQKLITRHSVMLLPYYPKSSLSWEFIVSMTSMVSYDLPASVYVKNCNHGPRNKFYAIPRFPTGSFAVYIGDHLRFGIICGSIWGSFTVWGLFAVGDHLRRCTNNQLNKISSGGKRNYRNVKFYKNNSLKEQVFLQSPLKN